MIFILEREVIVLFCNLLLSFGQILLEPAQGEQGGTLGHQPGQGVSLELLPHISQHLPPECELQGVILTEIETKMKTRRSILGSVFMMKKLRDLRQT